MQLFSRCFYVLFLIAISTCWQSVAADSLRWRTDLKTAIGEAQQDNKLVLLHFWDYQCPPCRRLEKNVFPRKDVAQAIEAHFIPVKINITDAPRLRRQYRIRRWPTDIILNADQQQLHRDVSEQSPAAFIALLNQMAARKNDNSAVLVDSTGSAERPTSSQRTQATIDDSRQSSFRIVDSTDLTWSVGDLQRYHPSSQLGSPTIPDSEATTPQTDFGQRPTAITNSSKGEQQAIPQPENHDPVAPVSNTQREPAQPLPLGLEGYCPVTLAGRVGKFPQWQPGNPKWGAIHRGRLYLFVGAEEQQAFLREPDRYSPVLSGRDVVRLVKHSEKSIGERRHGVTYRNRVYLFRDEYSLQEFRKAPYFFSREALKRMPIQR